MSNTIRLSVADGNYIDVNESSKLLGLAPQTIRVYLIRGIFSRYKYKNSTLLSIAEIRDYLKRKKKPCPHPRYVPGEDVEISPLAYKNRVEREWAQGTVKNVWQKCLKVEDTNGTVLFVLRSEIRPSSQHNVTSDNHLDIRARID